MCKIKDFFTDLWWKPRGWYFSICNIFAWIPLLWKDREWDYGFMLEIERFKLRRMCKWYKKNNYGHLASGERTYKQMKLAASLLDIILESDWWTIDDRYRKIFDENGKYIPTPDERYILKAYVNLGNAKRFMPYITDESLKKMPNLWRTELRVEKAWSLYHKYRDKYMDGWWD